ncbi:MAG: hypothetical protein KGK07_11200 [Chloroflexota bacterium]|nr:hypothetical protein [Chloroflexota bacterium]
MAEGHGAEVGWFDQFVANILNVTHSCSKHRAVLLVSTPPDCLRHVRDRFKARLAKTRSLAFVDGNKRTATITAILFLIARGHLTDKPTTIQVRLLGEVAVETAMSRLDVRDVADWLHRSFDP